MIRLAKPSDAAAILDIYGPYIRDTSITFETEVPTLSEFGARINYYLENWPWLVYEKNGIIAGYAYASRYRERVAYQWGVECSVYIHEQFQRMGIARDLYTKLFTILKLQGFTTVYAVINLPNDPSVAFHETMGFRYFATYEKVGYKLGKWKNVGWWQLQLNEYLNEPAAPVKFSAITNEVMNSFIK
jgi:phosphinothricin acetyltransferase